MCRLKLLIEVIGLCDCYSETGLLLEFISVGNYVHPFHYFMSPAFYIHFKRVSFCSLLCNTAGFSLENVSLFLLLIRVESADLWSFILFLVITIMSFILRVFKRLYFITLLVQSLDSFSPNCDCCKSICGSICSSTLWIGLLFVQYELNSKEINIVSKQKKIASLLS